MDIPAFRARILLISPDDGTGATIAEIGRALGAEVSCFASASRIGGGWDVVCLDETAPGASPSQIAGFRRDMPQAGVLWLSGEPRGATAEAALTAGADDVIGLPPWSPEIRARLGRLLKAAQARRERAPNAPNQESSNVELAVYAARLSASQESLQEICSELEAHTRDLQALLSAQEHLSPLTGAADAVTRLPEILSELFPGARIEATLAPREPERFEAQPRRVITADDPKRWVRATIPLVLGEEVLGALRLQAPDGVNYPARKLDLLEMLAGQTAQALHRNRLYEALSRGKAEWEQTFDTINDGISIIGPDYTVRRANRTLARRVGKEPRELIGLQCHAVFHGRDAPCSRCPVARAFETGEVALTEAKNVRTRYLVDHYAYPLTDGQGRVQAVISYTRDVTREEQLKESLRRSDKLATLGQIAAGVAHEINNPLTYISSYSQLLCLRLSDPKAIECATRIHEGIERIHRIVGNLMSFVRSSDETFYPLDINDIVADTLSFSRFEVTRGETRLIRELTPGLPKILGAKDQLEHLLVNLLTNARDAVGQRGAIRVRTDVASGRVLLQVEDDGVGMAPSEQEKIFEPFYTTKPIGKGTGLGLFVAAGIARKHEADISVWSEPGRGTRVSLSLPAFCP